MVRTFRAWNEDNAVRLGAALAYYTVFSLAPFLVIVIAVAGLAFGHEAARGRIVQEIGGLLGREGGEAVAAMLASAHRPAAGITATVVGLVTMLLGATAMFGELQSGLNEVWRVRAQGSTFRVAVRARLRSFALVLAVGFLFLVSLVVGAATSAVETWLGGGFDFAQRLVSLGMSAALFAAVYKILPDTPIAWRDVWIGSIATAVFFAVGQTAIAFYLATSTVSSIYGAAGSLVVLLVWVYYSAQIFFFGAEFTRVYAATHGSRRLPAPGSPADAASPGETPPASASV